MKEYYKNSWGIVIKLLQSDLEMGLSEIQCEERKIKYGDNKIYVPHSQGKLSVIFTILKQKLTYCVLAFCIYFFLRGFLELGFITLIICIFNIGSKIYYEISKEKEIEILQNLNTTQALVIRGGVEKLVEAEALVKGDIVYFRKNSLISADIRIIKSENLKVDEQNITGEVFLKEKYEAKIEKEIQYIGEIHNMLFRGSIIKEGTGCGIVVETGNNTQLGRLLTLIDSTNFKKHTLLNKIEKNILKVVLCLILIQLILCLVLPGKLVNKEHLFAYGIFTIISICIPVIILEYVKGIKAKIKLNNIEIINISVLDLVKSVKVIFLDKIGTLTKRELIVKKIYTNEEIIDSEKVNINDINIRRIIDITLLANNAKYNNENNWSKGDIYEVAYLKYAAENSISKITVENRNKREFQIPMDSNKKMLTTVNKTQRGYRANIRGTLESILDVTTHILINGVERELTENDINNIKMADMNFSRAGLITEAVGYRSFNYQPSKIENVESNSVFVGLIALENPLMDGLIDNIDELMDNGVLPIVFTEDNKINSEVLGRKLGLISSSEEVTSGLELSYLRNEELYKVVSKTRVFCRLTPELKLKIVSLYNNDGFKFAIEGETLGDLASVSLAEVGIVKGKVSSLLKRSGEIYTNDGGIKGFLTILKEHYEMNKSINRGLTIYTLSILSQIFAMSFHYLFTDKILFNEFTILALNFLLFSPIALMKMRFGEDFEEQRKVIIKALLFIVIPIPALFLIKDYYEFSIFVLIGGMLIFDSIINCKINYRSFNRGIYLLLLAILIYFASSVMIAVITSMIYSQILMLILGWLLFIFIISDIIIEKWQN